MKTLTTILACVGLALGASTAAAQTTKSTGPQVHRLTLRYAAPTTPPLRYRLVPPHEQFTAGNAAPVYMAAMLVLANQPEAWHNNVERLQAMPVEQLPREEVRALLAEAKPMLDQLHAAARRDACNWDLPRREHGAMTLLPHLHRMRPFMRLLSLNTRLAALEGRYNDAAASLQMSFALARHCQDNVGGVLLDGLVAAAVSQIALDDVAAVVALPDSPNLYWPLANLPRPLLDTPQIVRRERGFIYAALPALREPRAISDAQWQQVLIDMLREMKVEPPTKQELEKLQKQVAQINATLLARAKAERGLEAMGTSDAQAIAAYAVADMERWRDEREKWFGLPFWQGYRGLLETDRAIRDAQAKDANPLVTMEPKTASWFKNLVQPDRQSAALQTIEAVRAHGKVPAKLADVSLPLPADPATGAPFVYEARDGGFTLVSRIEGGEPADELRYEVAMK